MKEDGDNVALTITRIPILCDFNHHCGICDSNFTTYPGKSDTCEKCGYKYSKEQIIDHSPDVEFGNTGIGANALRHIKRDK